MLRLLLCAIGTAAAASTHEHNQACDVPQGG